MHVSRDLKNIDLDSWQENCVPLNNSKATVAAFIASSRSSRSQRRKTKLPPEGEVSLATEDNENENFSFPFDPTLASCSIVQRKAAEARFSPSLSRSYCWKNESGGLIRLDKVIGSRGRKMFHLLVTNILLENFSWLMEYA